MECTPEIVDSVYVLILTDRRVTVEDISEELEISVGTKYKIVQRNLAFSKVSFIGFSKCPSLSTRPHRAAKTVETISQFGREQLPHPPHRPNLSCSDFHLFGPSKEFLCETKFSRDDEMKRIISKWLQTHSKDFYAEEIQLFFYNEEIQLFFYNEEIQLIFYSGKMCF